jgi:hypothetical protein
MLIVDFLCYIGAGAKLDRKEVPAQPPPNHDYRDSGISIVHDSSNQVAEGRDDVWSEPAEQPAAKTEHDHG